MATAFNNARLQYLKTQVETASKEQLVLMLFDGILRFTEQARKSLREKAIEDTHNALMRAEAIVMELIVTVDREKGGEVAKNLVALHAYAYNALVQCNLRKDETKIDEVQGIYRNLRDGWVGAMSSLGLGSPAQPTPAARPPQPQNPQRGRPAAAPAPQARQTPETPPASGDTAGPVAAAAQTTVAKTTYGLGRPAMMSAYSRPAVQPGQPVTAAPLAAYQPQPVRNIA